MTDEGDHGGAPVIDGPLGTAAPTKSIVTLRRGGCPHPPVRGPPHQRYPPSSAPCGGTFPIPFVPSGHFPLTRGIGPLEGGRLRDVGSESFRHGCAAVGSFAALRMRRTPCGCCAPRNDRKRFIDKLKIPRACTGPGNFYDREALSCPEAGSCPPGSVLGYRD